MRWRDTFSKITPYRHSLRGEAMRPARRGAWRPLRLEPLENRMLLSVFTWANRGDATDQFDAAFGAGAPADAARAVVDAAIDYWDRVVIGFNHSLGVGPPDIQMTIRMDPTDDGCGASANTTISLVDGKPVAGNMTINMCDGDGDGVPNWFVDPTPFEHSEFMGNITGAFSGDAQAGSPAAGRGDLLGIVIHELGHSMGIATGAGNLFQEGSFLTDTGIADDAEGGGVGFFYLFQGPSINCLMTSFDSGAGDFGAAVHSAAPRPNNAPVNFGGATVYGAEEHMNAFYEFGRRYLLSNRTALMLKDAFNFDIVMPETFGTFYSVLDETTGVLTVRGGSDSTVINGVAQGADDDVITITRDGGDIVVSVDIENDVPGTGPGTHPLDRQDAFVSVFPTGQVTSIVVNAGGGDDTVTIGDDIGVPVTVNGEDGDDTLMGGDIVLIGGPGNDYLYGSNGNDTISGGPGNDTIYGLDGNDAIDGGLDDDVIYAGSGTNTVTSIPGDGDDLIDLSENAVAISLTAHGNDTVLGTAFDDTILAGDDGNVWFEGRGGDDTLTGAGGADRLDGGDGQDHLVGGSGSDTLLGGLAADVLEGGAGSDTIDGGDDPDTYVFDGQGVGSDDRITVSALGASVSISNTTSGETDTLGDIEQLDINTGNSDGTSPIGDQVTIESLLGTEIEVVNFSGGPESNNRLILNGTDVAETITVSNREGASPAYGQVLGLGPVITMRDFDGTFGDTLEINSMGGDDVIDGVAAGLPSPPRYVFNGGNGDDRLIGGAGDDSFDGGNGDDTFLGSGGNDTVAGGLGGDTILVEGTPAADLIALSEAAGVLTVTMGALTTTYDAASAYERIRIDAHAGDDLVTVDGVDTPITLDGGGGSDVLGILNGPAAATVDEVIYAPGPAVGEGRLVYEDAGDLTLMTIDFVNLEPVIDAVPAETLTVQGTNADNAMNYTAGLDYFIPGDAGGLVATGKVSVDGFETIEFARKANLVIDGLAGDDVISLNNPNTPLGLTDIRVEGADPTASDTVIVSAPLTGGGGPMTSTITYTPTGVGSGTVQVDALPLVTIATAELLVIDGREGNDTLTVVPPQLTADTIRYTPGTPLGSGEVLVNDWLPMRFEDLSNGLLNINDPDGNTNNDRLVVVGSGLDEQFAVLPTGAVNIGQTGVGGLTSVDTENIARLILEGMEGDDEFGVLSGHGYASIEIHGGGPAGSDRVSMEGDGASAMEVDFADAIKTGVVTVSGGGLGVVDLAGIELAVALPDTQNLTVIGTSTDDRIVVEQGNDLTSGPDLGTGLIQLDFVSTDLAYVAVGDLTINGGLGDDSDALVVSGTEAGETITVSGSMVDVAGYEPVLFERFEALTVNGLEGDDVFDVTPAGIPISIDGGDPIGTTPGDLLNLLAGGDPVIIEPGPEADEGGLLVGANERVSFDHIEGLSIPGPGPVLILGTNADDDITIIARDDSTHPVLAALTPGVQDFTVSVNTGPEILFIDAPLLYVDALAGDDDVVIRTPAPNQAEWDVDVFVAGGPPAASDRLVLETPGNDTVVFTPTGAGTGIVVIDEVTNDSRIEMGPFDVFWPSPENLFYRSSPGGIEHFIYDGESGNDALSVTGTLGDDTIVHTAGATIDAGGVQVNSLLPLSYENLGSAGTVTIDESAGAGVDVLVYEGTDLDDHFNVSANTGSVGLRTVPLFGFGEHVPVMQLGIEYLTLAGLDGDDQFVVSAPQPYLRVDVQGGGPGNSDLLQILGEAGTDDSVEVFPNGPGGEGTIIVNGAPVGYSGVEDLQLLGNPMDSDGLIINGTLAENVWQVERGSLLYGTRVQIDDRELIEYGEFSDVELRNGAVGIGGSDLFRVHPAYIGNLTVTGTGEDVLQIIGTGVDDVATATTTTVTLSITTITHAGMGQLDVLTLSGDDRLTVDVDSGHGSDVIGVPITFDGGAGSDSLVVLGTPATAVRNVLYSPGPAPGEGRFAYQDATDMPLMTVDFLNLEPVYDYVAAAQLIVSGTDADNAVSYTVGANSGVVNVLNPAGLVTGMVSVDAFETVEFGNKIALDIDGAGGDDVISLNNPTTPVGLTQIRVGGSDPTASDTVIVNGTPDADLVTPGIQPDSITVTPTGIGSATVQVNTLPLVTVQTAESLVIDGQGGHDDLTVATPATDYDEVTYTPGPTVDAGHVQITTHYGASLLPVRFEDLGDHVGILNQGVVTIDDSAGGDYDKLSYVATAFDDDISVSAPGPATVGRIWHELFLPLTTDGIEVLRLNTLAGDDMITVNVEVPYLDVDVDGGEPDASDWLMLENFVQTDYVVEHQIPDIDSDSLPMITALGTRFSLSGVEKVDIGAWSFVGGDTLLVMGSPAQDDVLTYSPLAGISFDGPDQAGTFRFDNSNIVYAFCSLDGTFTVDGSPNANTELADHLIVQGSTSHDVVIVDSPARTVSVENPAGAILKTVTLADDVEVVTTQTGLGNDTVLVIPAPNVGVVASGFLPYNLLVNVDGGPPGASDALVIAAGVAGPVATPLPATDFVVVNHSRRADEGTVRVFRGAVAMPDISYTDIEVVSPLVDPVDPDSGDPNLLILGPDMYEQNEYRATAAYLGSGDVVNVENLAIFPNAEEHRFVPEDQDYFRVVAEATGTLDFQVYFRMFDPGLLPQGGDLNIEVLDVDGDVIAGTLATNFGTPDATPDARVRIPAIAGQTYFLHVFGANNLVVNGYDATILNEAPPAPYDIELLDFPPDGTPNPPGGSDNSDTGRSQFDNVTYDNTPVIYLRLDDGIFLHDLPGNPADDSPPDEVIPIPFDPASPPLVVPPASYRVAIFEEGDPQQPGSLPQVLIGYARQHAEGVYVFDFDTDSIDPNFTLTDGSHFISARVQMVDPATPRQAGYGPRSDSLEIVVDIVPPPVVFGEDGVVCDGLHPDSDTGIEDQPGTFVDRITFDTTPSFWGIAEANTVVRLYADLDGSGDLDPAVDLFLGETVAIPNDGTNQFPRGMWNFTTNIDMNDPAYFPDIDGLRTIFATAEDLAGNLSEAVTKDIFIDTRGPQVNNVTITGSPEYHLFDPKPSIDGPTPLVHSLDIDFIDRPERIGQTLIIGDDAVFVIDVSGSTNDLFAGTAVVGDLNGDGNANTILDVEIAGFIALNQELINRGLGDISNVSIVTFSGGSSQLDMDPSAAGVQLSTHPNADADGDTVLDVEQVLRSLTAGGSTNYEAPLQDAIATINAVGTAVGNGNVIFLSDGFPNAGGAFNDEVATLNAMGMNLRAFGVGTSSSLSDLQTIDPTAVQFTTTDELLDVFAGAGGGGGGGSTFVYPAVNAILATQPGNIRVVGDHVGNIPIYSIEFIDHTVAGDIGRTTIRLNFFDPLPDDRFTVTVSDRIKDRAGNPLDGESNAHEPQDPLNPPDHPMFPSGDGDPGEDFFARFTVDSRPEIGTFSSGTVYIDINGNFLFDPQNEDQNQDYTNRDIAYMLGYTSDDIFAGNFSIAPRGVADGFDKLAAYGRVGGSFRWLIDVTSDAVPDLTVVDPAGINGLPVAGRFSSNDADGDEVGLFTGTTWWFDTNHDFKVDTALASRLRGYPIVGDFDGDGFDDLATWTDDTFMVDLAGGVRRGWDGVADRTFRFGIIGVRERPVAADMDQDGFEDFGLWSPDRSGVAPEVSAEWHFLVSGGASVLNRIVTDPLRGDPIVQFTPVPFGDDLFAQFGDEYALPVIGNFDPPVAASDSAGGDGGPQTVQLNGTAGDDLFEFIAGATPDAWTVRVNGTVHEMGSNALAVEFDGLGGHDTVLLSGTDGADTVELWPGRGTLEGSGYSVTVTHVESITASGLGGDDEATFHDSAGDDNFVSRRGVGVLTGSTVDNAVRGFETIHAHATAGRDVAKLYDSTDDDEFVGARDYGKLSGGGFVVQVDSFDAVHAYATGGGRDVAKVYDSTGDDSFYASPIEASLSGNGFFNRIKYFDAVRAYATAGGHDEAKLFDSQGADLFFGSPVEGALWGEGFYNRAKFFDVVTAHGTPGDGDAAVLHDSDGNDVFVATPKYRELRGDDFCNRVLSFDDVSAEAGGGFDVAKMYDSVGDDRFVAMPGSAELSGAGYRNQASHFDGVHAFATAGGIDEAELFDSDGADKFYSSSVESSLWGTGFYNRAKHFEKITAHGGDGEGDTAYLVDAALDIGYTSRPIEGPGAEYAKVAWLYEFDQYVADSGTSQTTPAKQEALDEVLTAYWP